MLFYILILFGLYGWVEFEALIFIGNEIGGLASLPLILEFPVIASVPLFIVIVLPSSYLLYQVSSKKRYARKANKNYEKVADKINQAIQSSNQ